MGWCTQLSRNGKWALSLLLLVATSCATPSPKKTVAFISAQLQSFSRLDNSGKTRFRYSFVELPEQSVSLEYKTYQELVRQNLAGFGWREVDAAAAEVAVGFVYGIDDGKEKKVSTPVWGRTGVAAAVTTVNGDSFGSYVASTNFIPSYGVVGYSESSYVEYSRRFALYVFESKTPGLPLYEARVASVGPTGVLSQVISCVIRSVFDWFPAANGYSANVSKPMTSTSCGPVRPSRDWAIEDAIEDGFMRLRSADLDGALDIANTIKRKGNQSQVERAWMLSGAVACVRNDADTIARSISISSRVYDYLEEFCATRGVQLPPRPRKK